MARESADTKGRRYLLEGRLTVIARDERHVDAVCRGDGVEHHLGHDANRGWFCSCPCFTPNCSHLAALRLVVVVNRST